MGQLYGFWLFFEVLYWRRWQWPLLRYCSSCNSWTQRR